MIDPPGSVVANFYSDLSPNSPVKGIYSPSQSDPTKGKFQPIDTAAVPQPPSDGYMVPNTPGSQQIHGTVSFVAGGQPLLFSRDPDGSVMGMRICKRLRRINNTLYVCILSY
jgi:hypothetical protein